MDMFCYRPSFGSANEECSTLLPYQDFDPLLGDQYVIPRRFPVKQTSLILICSVTIAAYQAQGYTYEGEMSNSPVTLSKERVWYDKEAPAFGKVLTENFLFYINLSGAEFVLGVV